MVGRDAHASVINSIVEECSYQLLVGAVAQRLRSAADGRRVVGGVGGSLLREAPHKDLLGGPRVEGAREEMESRRWT
jgi:hypothetical protein